MTGLIIMIVFGIVLVILLMLHKRCTKAPKKSKTYANFHKIKITERKRTMTVNLSSTDKVVGIARYTDANGNARHVENPVISTNSEQAEAHITQVSEYTDDNGQVGTEVAFESWGDAEGLVQVSLVADPKLGDPVGEITLSYNMDITTEASTGIFSFNVVPRG